MSKINITEPSREEIARRAYEIWEQANRPANCEAEHWAQAEQQLASPKEVKVRMTRKKTKGQGRR